MYYMNVMNGLYNPSRLIAPRYEHFESIEGRFYNNVTRFRIVSTNGFAININSLPEDQDFRITRFVRDPRDLIISGYFYHRKGAEPWFRFTNPTNKYFEPINGNTPSSIPPGKSYSEFLQSISKEEGLIAEIEFRKYHLESLRYWADDPRIKIFRYEEIMGNEIQTFDEIFKFYEVSSLERKMGLMLAKKYAAKPGKKNKHIRNHSSGQWKEHFTPKVNAYFNDLYGDTLELLSY